VIVTAEAVVLRTRKYRDTSLVATLLTRHQGKIGVIAKGARDRKSRLGPSLQVMNHVTVVYYHKTTRDLQLLTQCDLVRAYRGLSDDMEKMASGMATIELVDAVTPAEEANEELFDLLTQTLSAVNGATKNARNALYYFEMRLLQNLGFRPDLHVCCQCATPLEGGTPVRGAHMSIHGIVCPSCSGKGFGMEPLSAPAVRVLQRLQEIENPEACTRMTLTPHVRGEVAGVLRRFLLGHVEGLRTLRSEEVFSSLL
jgi:DNA repair protein RecO (recombination protein O)